MEARISSPIDIPNTKKSYQSSKASTDKVCLMSTQVTQSERAAYDSPSLSRASNDFMHVMVKLHPCSSMDSFSGETSSPASYSPEPQRLSVSCPVGGNLVSIMSPQNNRRTRHRVRFDEATITLTAELGESASKFRSRFREKNKFTNANHIKFGSKNISFQHIEETTMEDEQNNATPPTSEKNGRGKSIFDVCNYSSYGRYT